MHHKFLVHDGKDNVGVAVDNIASGELVKGISLDNNIAVELRSKEGVLLGHKIALVPMSSGNVVIKYGVPIGIATEDINKGEHVHVHNLKSARW